MEKDSLAQSGAFGLEMGGLFVSGGLTGVSLGAGEVGGPIAGAGAGLIVAGAVTLAAAHKAGADSKVIDSTQDKADKEREKLANFQAKQATDMTQLKEKLLKNKVPQNGLTLE